MKMDRNLNPDGRGKYALIKLRQLPANIDDAPADVEAALRTLHDAGVIEWGITGEPDEFFVIKLRDRNARGPLCEYARSIQATDPEFAAEVVELASRAGPHSPWCKDPD